jgi:hypothetical protein
VLWRCRNALPVPAVYWFVTKRWIWAVPFLAAGLAAGYDSYLSAQQKFAQIAGDRLRPGTRVVLTSQELDAYVAHEAPDGVRDPHLTLPEPGLATGTARIDFGRVRRSQGHRPGWLMSKLLDGERPVSVTARIGSGDGHATVDVQKVQISGVEIDGATLEFLIQNVLLPLYPDAAVGRPFELGHHIEKLDVGPGAVRVVIGK